METSLFDDVADAVRGLLPSELGEPHIRAHRYGIKVWFGTVKPTASTTRRRSSARAMARGTRAGPGGGFHSEIRRSRTTTR